MDAGTASSPSTRLILLLAVWYLSSLLTSLSTKEILLTFPHPVTIALVQQAIAAVCGCASFRPERTRWDLLGDVRLHTKTLQMSTVMVVSLTSYRWALMSASVAFIHTVKTLGPVFTIAFSRLMLSEQLPLARCAAVAPIILGVALTSITDAEFSGVGFMAALLSTATNSLQSVAAKRLLHQHEVAKAELFAMAALHAFLMLLPLSLAVDVWRLTPLAQADALRVCRWLALNGLCSFVNQYVALSVLDAMVSPLSYALANARACGTLRTQLQSSPPPWHFRRPSQHGSASHRMATSPLEQHARSAACATGCLRACSSQVMKRATVITFAMAYAARPVTPEHLCGVGLSLIGAVGYQQAGAICPTEAEVAAKSEYALLPLHQQPVSGGGAETAVGKTGADAVQSTDSASTSGSSDASSPVPADESSPHGRGAGAPGCGISTGSPRTCGVKSWMLA